MNEKPQMNVQLNAIKQNLWTTITDAISAVLSGPFWWVLFSLILIYHPVLWLMRTWQDPAYQTSGLWIALIVLALFCLSVTSSRGQFTQKSEPSSSTEGLSPSKWIGLAVLSCGCRLLSQVFAIHILGALALVVDVYVLASWLELQKRGRPISPFWLSILFLWSLPIGHLFQRCGGFILQWISAQIAGVILSFSGHQAMVFGTEIHWLDARIMVDPPCSGASSFILSLMIWTLASCLTLPQFNLFQWKSFEFIRALKGLTIALLGAILANICRIIVLSLFSVFENPFGVDFLQEPAHSLIGLITLLCFVILPLGIWANGNLIQNSGSVSYASERSSKSTYLKSPSLSYSQFVIQLRVQRLKKYFAGIFPVQTPTFSGVLACLFALWIVNLPHQPMDISTERAWQTLPSQLAGVSGQAVALNSVESHYFQQFGGHALKVRYGQTAVILVQTASPLRHLHDPGDCLRGMGYDVQFVDRQQGPYPSNRFQAISPEGKKYWVDVVFKSSSGQVVTSVSEAILLWLQQPQTHWMAIQRIRPIQEHPEWQAQDFRLAKELGHILDLNVNPSAHQTNPSILIKTLTALLRQEISLTQARSQDVIPDYVLSQNHNVYQFKEDYDVP
jgi:exosortase/archaeosortase family protein